MRLFDNLRLAVKLPIVLGTLALLSLLAMGYTSHRTARDALIDAGEARILTMINAKLLEYHTARRHLGANTLLLVSALLAFGAIYVSNRLVAERGRP